MSHDLTTRKNGFVEMAYVGEKPWHGLGQELKAGASIEEWQRAAGMDWRIHRSKVRYAVSNDARDELRVDAANHVLFRSDSKAPLGIVSDGFKIVQPSEVLEFFRDLVHANGFELNTAGTLKGGRKFWAQAVASLRDSVVGNDMVEGKLLIATACDGTMRTVVKTVAERVVCANTLAMAMGESSARIFQVSHRSHFDPLAAKRAMGLVVHSFHEFVADARELARCEVKPSQAESFILEVVCEMEPDTTHSKEELDKLRSTAGFRKVMELYNGAGRGSTAKGSKGTLWGLVNAVTEYVDHHRGRSNDTRLEYAWFGPGDALKTEAFKRARAYAQARQAKP